MRPSARDPMRLMSLEPWSDPAPTWQASLPRHEVKFIGASFAEPFVTSSLAALCAPDDQFPENVVHSIYFDSPDLASYAEKANGDYLKTKLRLRWYAERRERASEAGGPWTAWLELKMRTGSRGAKRRRLLRLPGPS